MGAAMALESATTTVDGAMKHTAGSEFEENCKLLLRHVEATGDKGLTKTRLTECAGVGKIEPRKLKDAMD